MEVDTKHGGYAKSVDMSGKQQSVQDVLEEVALNVQGKRGKFPNNAYIYDEIR